MNDNFPFYALIFTVTIGLGLCVGMVLGSNLERKFYEKVAIERGFAHFETASDRTIKFIWHTNLTQVKP